MKDFIYRDYTKDDEAYIYTAWTEHLHKNPFFKGSRHRYFVPDCKDMIRYVLSSNKARVMIVSPKDDTEHIAAFCVLWVTDNVTTLWWIHTREMYRKKGICKHICEKLPGKKVHVFDKQFVDGKKLSKVLFRKLGFEFWPSIILQR